MGGIVGGIVQSRAASKAAKAQTAAANEQLNYQKEIYADQTERFSPFLDAGTNALAAFNFNMGLGDRPMVGGTPAQIETITGPSREETFRSGGFGMSSGGSPETRTRMVPGAEQFRVNGQTFAARDEAQAFANANKTGGTAYGGFQASPGYEFRREQGIGAIDASAAARGGLNSGRTLQDLTRFGDGLAAQEFDSYMARLGGLTDMGMGAAGMQATAGNNAAAGVGNALANRGNAQAAGAIGQGNAFTGMVNNLAGSFGYMNNPGGSGSSRGGGINGNGAWANPLFGGKGLGGFV